MKPKTCLIALAPILKNRSFTAKEALTLGVSSATLSYYVKTGKLKRVCKGIYCGVDNEQLLDSKWSDLVDSLSSIQSGIICLISALDIYNLTEELPRQHWIGIRHGTSVKRTKQIKIIRFRDIELGKTEINLDGIIFPIFDQERTIVDAFRLLSRETAIKALKAALARGGKYRLDLAKLELYAKKLRFNITPYLLSLNL